jgi:NAD(P)H-nitrite reductase large subunit
MGVTRCVCREVSFGVVVRAAEELRRAGCEVSLDMIVEATTAGTGCGTCRPYLARAIVTGETNQPVMSPAECRAWVSGEGTPAREARPVRSQA